MVDPRSMELMEWTDEREAKVEKYKAKLEAKTAERKQVIAHSAIDDWKSDDDVDPAADVVAPNNLPLTKVADGEPTSSQAMICEQVEWDEECEAQAKISQEWEDEFEEWHSQGAMEAESKEVRQ